MLRLPKATEVNKQLPKKAIYANFHMKTSEKENIDADISRITIANEISPNGINISAGEKIKSFFVLHVILKRQDFDEKTIATLSKIIPQNILFVLEYNGESKLAIYHLKLMQTGWQKAENISIVVKGSTLDDVWENIVVQVGSVKIEEGNTLDVQINVDEKRQKILKEMERLDKLARKERQPKRKFGIVQQVNKMRKELEEL